MALMGLLAVLVYGAHNFFCYQQVCCIPFSVSADRYVRKSGAGSGRKIVERNTQYHESLFES